jgi:Flp pilus assembly protein TadG
MPGSRFSSSGRSGLRAQAIVEFALILPVFLLIVMMVVDLGRAFSTYDAIANAAREGARSCALFKDSAGATARVTSELGSGFSPTVTFSPACSSTLVAGTSVTVKVQTTFQPITVVISQITGNSIILQASATMMVAP